MTHWAKANTNMSTASINFWAGGLSAQLFWTLAYPSDVVKQTIMIDSVTQPKFKHWIDAFRHVYSTRGYQGFFRGFIPSSIR